jgi:GDPmannose 4,6-dehydratase
MDAIRDWGYAPEYVEGMWRMLQADEPQDYVLATGVGATVGQFVEAAFAAVGRNWVDHVVVDPSYFRPAEVDYLLGNPLKAEQRLGWKAATLWPELAQLMVEADVKSVQDQLAGRLVRADR